jgi:hypothetical protein
MAQQTAVEWLVEQLIPKAMVTYDATTYNAVQQAKAMEKKQRIRDYNAGYTDAQCNHINDAENYVNEQEYLNNNL